MCNDFYEVVRDGKPLHYLFFTPQQAEAWIRSHSDDGAEYTIRKFVPPLTPKLT